MKCKYLLAFTLSALALGNTYAQGELDVYKLSKNELRGTARSVSMGGAFGALGGDISGIAINPAGIGVYTKSEIVTTLSFENVKSETNFGGNKLDKSKFTPSFDNLAFVAAFPLYNDDVPFINFGFSYNRLKSFNRRYSSQGTSSNTLVDYMATRAERSSINHPDDLYLTDAYDPFAEQGVDWMGALGVSSHLLESEQVNGNYQYSRNSYLGPTTLANSDLFVREKGSINSYDFNMGTTISDIVSAGITVSVTDINYKLSTEYFEDFLTQGQGKSQYGLYNDMKTEGTGWQLKLGAIIKPINELRIGIAYHTPTWYKMTDYYSTGINYDLTGVLGNVPNVRPNDIFSAGDYLDYEMRTPDKWVFSLAGIIGKSAIISVDYELTNYSNMKLYDYDGRSSAYSGVNSDMNRHFRTSSTLRIGAEYRITNQLSARAGYSWVQSPLEADFKKHNKEEVMTVGTISNFVLDGDTNYITYGLGYKFNQNFYTDVAFLMASQKDDLYSFSKVFDGDGNIYADADKSKLKTNRFQGMLTFGYKF